MRSDSNPEPNSRRPTLRDSNRGEFAFARHVLIATSVVASVVLVLALVWYAANLLMLLFAGILVSILLRRVRGVIRNATGFGEGQSLAVVTILLFATIAVVGWLVADRIASQAAEFMDRLRTAVPAVRARLEGYEWAQQAIDRLPGLSEMFFGRGGVLSRLPGVASTALGVIFDGVIVIVFGLYLASQPRLYSAGIKHLLPFRARRRAGEVLSAIDQALGRWLLGRFGLMVINGGLTTAALWLVGVPLAPTLGLIAGVLNFIPNFGPFIAAVPAVLIGLVQSPQTALYAVIVFVVVQTVDAYILTPLVDRKSVELPPVLTVAAQLLLGVMFGFVGLLLASPLAAAAMILVKMLYVEDVLGEPIMGETTHERANRRLGVSPPQTRE
jgi:predicted PurR-regulated permease PerM